MWCITVLCAVLSLAVGAGDLGALTIYRIGGGDLPPPELASEEGVDFVQLEWEEVDAKRHGEAYLLEMQELSVLMIKN